MFMMSTTMDRKILDLPLPSMKNLKDPKAKAGSTINAISRKKLTIHKKNNRLL